MVDSYEQPRERPTDNKEQQKYFSGKKRQHTFKNQVVSLPSAKDIVDMVVGAKGPTSDISLFRHQQQKFSTALSNKKLKTQSCLRVGFLWNISSDSSKFFA
ncbi:transposase family protein [Chroococcidiopsis sp [FACHB-1243]]|uniref:transposase family protein n=1 Tax=Chroococcidiopsis sp. [FACHB-1243] TaxID=2692781 RepID=UPI00322083BC